MKTDPQTRPAFGSILSQWRKKRRFSQLSFAHFADISARHLSFLETGRANPSRQMVLKLADCLQMPRPDINSALLAAGFSPVYLARSTDDIDLAPLRAAIDTMLDHHLPFPGLVFDRHWNIVQANQAARHFLHRAGFTGSSNLLEILAAQPATQSSIQNWEEVVGLALERLRTEIYGSGEDKTLLALEKKLADRFARHCRNPEFNRSQAVIPTTFMIEGKAISVFSTITQFGTVQDLTLEDMRVELMFPMDEVSRGYFQEVNFEQS